MKKLVVPLLAVLIAGCANVSQQKMASACATAQQDPRLAPLWEQVPKSATAATMAQLADQRKAAPGQKPAIEAIQPAYAACVAATSDYLARAYGRPAAAMYQQLNQELLLTEVALWQGKITFGEFNATRAKLVSGFMQAAEQSRQQSMAAASQIEYTRLQNALSIMNATRIPVQSYTSTSCYSSGRYVNCTSY